MRHSALIFRSSSLLILATMLANAAEPDQPYPFWDGEETIAEYANRFNLLPTKALDLGGGVQLELVLIPAGKFVMGTEEPNRVDEGTFAMQIFVGRAALTLSTGVLLVILAFVVIRAIREKHRPQVSLARLLVLAVIAGIGLMGGLHWHFSALALSDAESAYRTALARFRNADDKDKPAHEVTLTKPYYMGKFEVTQEQYQQVMGTNPSRYKGRGLPVEEVSWNDAQAFCKKASEKSGATIRLPSEAEWEYACRAGTRTAYFTGDTETDLDRAGWYGKNSKGVTQPVGQKMPNAWGVHDMHGNVLEWCSDWYGPYKAKAETSLAPLGQPEGAERVLRGGSWFGISRSCRSARRAGCKPIYSIGIGLRVVVEIP